MRNFVTRCSHISVLKLLRAYNIYYFDALFVRLGNIFHPFKSNNSNSQVNDEEIFEWLPGKRFKRGCNLYVYQFKQYLSWAVKRYSILCQQYDVDSSCSKHCMVNKIAINQFSFVYPFCSLCTRPGDFFSELTPIIHCSLDIATVPPSWG